jgi:transcriptional regulator
MNELSEEDIIALLRNVVSFEIPIERMEAKFKLNQGETRDRNVAAVAALERQGSRELAEYMRRYNDL